MREELQQITSEKPQHFDSFSKHFRDRRHFACFDCGRKRTHATLLHGERDSATVLFFVLFCVFFECVFCSLHFVMQNSYLIEQEHDLNRRPTRGPTVGVSGDKKGLHWYQWYDWYQGLLKTNTTAQKRKYCLL